MPLYLTEEDVGRALTMPECIDAVERIFLEWASGKATVRPRLRTATEGAMLHVLPAASAGLGRMAAKVYATTRTDARFVVLLFDAGSSELLAILEADRLGQIRTGAASGLATRWLARKEAAVLGLLGTGWQARSQALAMATVRTLRAIRAYGRDRERLQTFCREVESACGVPVTPAASAEEAVRGADIVVTATNAATPVLKGDWIEPGLHLNAVGSNRAERRELDERAVRRADLIVVDYLEQARLEAGDLIVPPCDAAEQGIFEKAIELAAIVAGRHPGRTSPREVTLFKSLGIGLEDLAAASLVFDKATAAGAGRRL
jgi:alanine dehydrogenase